MPQWGADARGRQQGQYQQNRYQNQQGPMAQMFAHNYGRGSEADWGNYNDIMNRYRSLYGGGEGGSGGGGGGFDPSLIGYNDPFKSYGGFTAFSETGGYSPEDMANLRARGVSPIRAAYGNAVREVGRQRSLQGGYSPNAIATRAMMARQQGQSMSDALQSVEGGIVDQRNRNMLAGLGGMSNIEGQRLGADLDVAKFNANAMMSSGAANSAAGASAAAASSADRFRALSGMANLYGTTPGMSNMFGNQLMGAVGQGGTFGLGMMGQQYNNAQLPGNYDIGMSRGRDIYNTGSRAIYPWLNDERQRDFSGYGGYGGYGQYDER